ncbi:transcription factor bHLH133 isoform X2 [Brassica rapa]|uniref:transcription factor bHLH133 isoform X2 n=1 Tax=Brassica campestris TaxID=3711 RepID=UPI00142E7D4D|nr:transcription factor bHLH133 isoform X2 [Brassica rapa]
MTDTRVLESSPVRNLTAARNQNWWNKVSGGLMPPQLPPCTASYHLLPSLLPNYFPSPTSSSSSLPPISNPNVFSWLHNNDDLPLDQLWSHSKLLLGGLMMGDEERMEMMNHHHHHHQNQHHTYQEKKTENWEEEVLRHQASIKQEISNNNGYMIISSPKSPLNKSCVTTTTIHNFNEDSNKNDNNGLNFSKCNSLEISGSCFANKKPKLQVPSLRPLSQPILKVSKEKLGGRIAALHQLVSPYGKVLSVPYFVTPSRNNIMHQQARGDMNGLFPQDPGQLVSEYCMKRSNGVSSSSTNKPNLNEETKKDLKSRGLCLVPISCTLQVGSYNGTDYWAPAFGITFQ